MQDLKRTLQFETICTILRFSDFFKMYDLIQSLADPCFFFSTSTSRLTLILWVDDGLAMCKDKQLLDKMITHLKTAFQVTVCNADVYIGIHITDISHDRFRKTLYIDQQRYTKTIL